MDPTVTFATMLDDDVHVDDRLIAAEDLREWLDGGGFLPEGLPVGGGTAAARRYVDERIAMTLLLARFRAAANAFADAGQALADALDRASRALYEFDVEANRPSPSGSGRIPAGWDPRAKR